MKNLRSCTTGAVAVVTAMVLPALIGFVSLGTEVGHWYLAQRQMQGAVDAAAISAAAQYIADFPTNPSSLTYQTVGQSYAASNGVNMPIANVCLIPPTGSTVPENCDAVRSLDSRTIVCNSRPCVVVEATVNPAAQWLTANASLKPAGHPLTMGSIFGSTLYARAVVSAASSMITIPGESGKDCILALAPDIQAVLVHGNNADLRGNCGVAIDGGSTGGITFNGAGAKVNIWQLNVAASSAACPSSGVSQCQQYCTPTPPATTCTGPLLTNVTVNHPTSDPYASLTYPTPPLGVQTSGVVRTAAGSGYTPGLRTFTIVGGTGTPAKFTATVASTGSLKGQVPTTITVIDPGAYAVFPTGTVVSTADDGMGSGATFTLTEGCFTWTNTPIAGRKYCSIKPTGTINFPTGSYYIAGGDNSGCAGWCMSGNNHHVTSDAAGVTFYLTNGDGTNSRGASFYATVNISGFGNSSTLALCAPGTNCGTGCSGTCLLFVQGAPAAVLAAHPIPQSTSQGTPTTTANSFSGNGASTMSGLIYLPKQTFQTQGNSTIGGCFGVVAKYVDVGGTPTFSNGCLPGSGIGGGTTTTVTTYTTPYLAQ
jgi:Flp pilus assembly protein TadG